MGLICTHCTTGSLTSSPSEMRRRAPCVRALVASMMFSGVSENESNDKSMSSELLRVVRVVVLLVA
jgi:hypothetical protein